MLALALQVNEKLPRICVSEATAFYRGITPVFAES